MGLHTPPSGASTKGTTWISVPLPTGFCKFIVFSTNFHHFQYKINHFQYKSHDFKVSKSIQWRCNHLHAQQEVGVS